MNSPEIWYACVWYRPDNPEAGEWRGNIRATLAEAIHDRDYDSGRGVKPVFVRMISVERTEHGDIEHGTVVMGGKSSGRSGGGRYSDE